MKRKTIRIGQVAAQSGVTVRALHHYDDIGLLTPSARSARGYRLYTDEDLLKLQQILIGRELGLPLEAIRQSLAEPTFDYRAKLLDQRQQLQVRAAATARMLRAIDAALAALEQRQKGIPMSPPNLFDGFNPEDYEAEAKARWGDTDAYQESAERTKGYTAADWAALKAEQTAIYDAAFQALQRGLSPDCAEAKAIAERHRQSIDRWFYPCNAQMHGGLADMYEADTRFATNIDQHGAGLTRYLSAAIRANANLPTATDEGA